MKKIYFAIIALATLTLASCEKEPIGNTATQKMAGEWYVLSQAIDSAGNVLFDDPFDIGQFYIHTYNTAANRADSMFMSDMAGASGQSLWDFQVKVGCDIAAGTFGVKGGEDIINGISIDVMNGKILRGAAKTPSGMPADSIVFDILFSDDTYVGQYYDFLRVTGYRYTGLVNDD